MAENANPNVGVLHELTGDEFTFGQGHFWKVKQPCLLLNVARQPVSRATSQ
jgi:hypothetical protein